jgi:hypothetical protein
MYIAYFLMHEIQKREKKLPFIVRTRTGRSASKQMDVFGTATMVWENLFNNQHVLMLPKQAKCKEPITDTKPVAAPSDLHSSSCQAEMQS